MSKFNTATPVRKPTAVNYAGGQAWELADREKLVTLLLTSFLSNQYYRTGSEALATLQELARSVDPLFAAKAAIYARDKFNMRSVTHVVAGETAARVKGEAWTKRFYDMVVVRPDDVTEILAYYAGIYGLHPLPNSLKKGLAEALRRFDEYRLAKYQGKSKSISMVDAINLVHPKATPAIDKLMNGTLEAPDTWEVAMTRAGQEAKTDSQKAKAKEEQWERLLREGKLGYMALVRNLRNIENTGNDELVGMAATQLVDKTAIKKSRMLPFRFESALAEIRSMKLKKALSVAEEIALDNVPVLPGKTLVAVDDSGSMFWGGTGDRSKVRYIDIASLFAAALVKSENDTDVLAFASNAVWVDNVNPHDSLSTIRSTIMGATSGGTNFHAVFELAKRSGRAYDRVIILSDEQGWVGYYTPEKALNEYKKATGADPHIYSVDLAGYGTSQFDTNKVYLLSGFSEKMFDVMAQLEEDRQALIREIEAIVI
jgi:60 kDa SS-A/Ro ribonucleoprotein